MRRILYPLLVLLIVVVGACAPAQRHKPAIMVSIPPLAYFAERIVGDSMTVGCLIAKGENPENFEPTMSRLMEADRSDLFFMVGHLGFEDVVVGKLRQSSPSLVIVDTSADVPVLTDTHGHSDNDDDGHHHHEVDPHIWSSIPNARIIAYNMFVAIKEYDPDNADYYTYRYNQFMVELDRLEASIKAQFEASSGRDFIVWHPSLSYFARDYGLTQIALGADNKELSAPALKQRLDMAAATGSPVPILLQPEYDSRQASVIQEHTGGPVVRINPLSDDWAGEMLHTARAIANPGEEARIAK